MEFKSLLVDLVSSFSTIDYVVVGISLAVILLCGLYHAAFSKASPEDFLLGGRNMSPFPVAVSTAMLYISVLFIIDGPAEVYYYGIESFMMSIVAIVAIPLSVFLLVPMFHKMQMTSLFRYTGYRFNSTLLRCTLSFVYVVQQLIFTCVILGIVGKALEHYFQVNLLTSVISVGVFTAINASLGGFKASVWIHVFQFICIILFLIILVAVSASKAGGIMDAFDLAAKNGRLELFNFKLDPFMRHNFYNFAVGYGFISVMQLITNQSIVQRYSSLQVRRTAMRSLIMSIPLHILPSFLCLLAGIFLQAGYAGCDPLKLGRISQPQELVPYFIKQNLSFIPGLTGFFTACVVGSGISVCCASINSITACTFQDFISKLECCCTSDQQRGQAACCRFISFTYSALMTVMTSLAIWFSYNDKILLFESTSNVFAFNAVLFGPLAAVILMAMFFPCINKYGASIGFLAGASGMAYLAYQIILHPTPSAEISPLPPIMGSCPDAKALNTTFLRFLPWHPKDVEAMSLRVDDISDVFSLSYLLLTLFGAIVTLIIGFAVSALTGGFCTCASRKVPVSLLHPMLRFSDCCVDSEERQLQHSISHRYVDRINSVHNIFPGTSTILDVPPSYKYSSVPTTPPSV